MNWNSCHCLNKTLIRVALTHTPFTVALLSPCLVGQFLYNPHADFYGITCLLGSFGAWGAVFEDSNRLSIGSICLLTYFPCNVCVILWPIFLFRWLKLCVWPVRSILILGSITSIALPTGLVFHDSLDRTEMRFGVYLWIVSILMATAMSLLPISRASHACLCTNKPMNPSGGSGVS